MDFDVAAGCDLPYYRIPVRPIYKGYLVYAPGHEPPGYFDWLQQQEPVILWDDRGHAPPLANEADWIHAGEITFDAARVTNTNISVEDVRDPIWLEKTGAPVRGDGTLPALQYVIRSKGVVELGALSCGFCHTRVMPDGSMVKGLKVIFRCNAPPRSDGEREWQPRKISARIWHNSVRG